jgi:hypothetical protein
MGTGSPLSLTGFLAATHALTTAETLPAAMTHAVRLTTFILVVRRLWPSFYVRHLQPFNELLGLYLGSWMATWRYETRNRRAQPLALGAQPDLWTGNA